MTATLEDLPKLYAARIELRLGRPGHHPLRSVPINPDPLAAIATAVTDIRPDLGERAEIALDLVPLARSQSRLHRRRAQREVEQFELGNDSSVSGMLGDQWRMAMATAKGQDPSGRPGPQRNQQRNQAVRRRAADAARSGKLSPDQPIFSAQLLIQVTARHPGRATSLAQSITSAFTAFAGANYWRAAGTRIGPVFLGAGSWLHRRRFDQRFTTGLHAAHRDSVVTADEIAALLKPVTRNCTPRNVTRSGGLVPTAPQELPTYHLGSRTLMPLGNITTHGGSTRLAGVPHQKQLFSLLLGKSGYGKTEMMLVQMIALAHAGFATWFLDPHRDGVRRALPYLAHEHLATRIWDIDLTVRRDHERIAGWNPLNMEGRGPEDIPDVVQAITDSFASALGWGTGHSRALTILSRAIEALADLAHKLAEAGHPELTPTIFQVPTLLADEEWRELVVGQLDREYARFWERTFSAYSSDAMPVVTNAIERLATSRSAKGFLGQPRSGYNARTAMDTGRIVFISPAGVGPTDRLVSNMLIFDLFRAGLSRRDTPVDDRRDAYAWIDELTAVDGGNSTIAAIVEQLRKYLVHLFAGTQMAGRLSQATRDALLQNVSMLSTSAAEADAARMVTRQWSDAVEAGTVMALPKYRHVMSVTLDDAATGPFKVHGAEVSRLYAPWHRPQNLGKLERCIDRNLGRRPLGQVLAEQAELDDKIARFLSGMD